MGHTTQAGVHLIGFGPSAISELSGSYAQSIRDLDGWHAAVADRGLSTLRGHRLSADDLERRWIIERLICHGEIRAGEFEAHFGHAFASRYAPELEALAPAVDDGLVEVSRDGSLCVTPLGRLLVRNLATAFDRYLAAQRESGRPLFSRTV